MAEELIFGKDDITSGEGGWRGRVEGWDGGVVDVVTVIWRENVRMYVCTYIVPVYQ